MIGNVTPGGVQLGMIRSLKPRVCSPLIAAAPSGRELLRGEKTRERRLKKKKVAKTAAGGSGAAPSAPLAASTAANVAVMAPTSRAVAAAYLPRVCRGGGEGSGERVGRECCRVTSPYRPSPMSYHAARQGFHRRHLSAHAQLLSTERAQRGQSVPRAAVSSSLATERVGERARRACAPSAGDGFTAPGASAAACVHATMRSSLSFISSSAPNLLFSGKNCRLVFSSPLPSLHTKRGIQAPCK